MKTRTILAAFAVAALAGSAHAASHARDTFIKEQDQNGDGVVSKDEFAATRAIQFAKTDADKNGTLSQAEYVGEFKARLEKKLAADERASEKKEEERVRQMRQADVRFNVLDSDKSSAITRAEFDYSGWRMFSHHDTNNDGTVSAADPIKEDQQD
ncbi:EF-hand domain-containing protein [Caulobacter segnis]|uniref:EF-hand domain-containing protein n=1 Tax=Caulobacter segnis TaxID=88688 RepID=UPI001CBB43DB|nr:EF-hand domain-containing protein [Caulobacter segnis]UAL08990.1 EF-hand domain-containing protein [Caulobacter segnis]